MSWSTACPDWEARLLSGKSLIPDFPLITRAGTTFHDQGEKALRIFKRLKVPDIEGFPTYGDICGEWVFDLVRVIFGSYDIELKRRMIREFFLLVPKKNGKSSIAAAIMVTAIILNRRPEAEFLLIAPTKKIADISFKQAAGIIRLDPQLVKLFYPQNHQRTITHRLTLAVLVIKAADTDVITGSKSTGILVDETHVFAKMSKAADVFVEIRGGLASRPDGFMLQITTQSKDQPTGVFKAELEMARDVRDGKIILPLLPILYELPAAIVDGPLADGNGWQDRKYWPFVNPNLNRSVDLSFLSDELLKAQRQGTAELALLASQHFNVEIGLKLRSGRWAGADFWIKSAERVKDLDDLLARSEVVVCGIDGGGLDDLLGFVVIGREKQTGKWLVWARAWANKIVLKRRPGIVAELQEFEKEHTLKIVDLPGLDVIEVADIVMRIEEMGLLAEEHAIGVDSVGIGDIVDELTSEERGIDITRIVGVSQGWKLSGAIKTAERKIAGGELIHEGSALMRWNVENAKAEPKGNATSITKQISGATKIDVLMAMFNAVSLMAMNPPAASSAYEDEEMPV